MGGKVGRKRRGKGSGRVSTRVVGKTRGRVEEPKRGVGEWCVRWMKLEGREELG